MVFTCGYNRTNILIMKTIVFFRLLAVLFVPVCVHAQDVSISDLVQSVACSDKTCYEGLITARAFHFNKQLELNGVQYHYQSDAEFSFKGSTGETFQAHDEAYFQVGDHGNYVSSLLTHRKERYDALLDELKEKGFKKTKVENENSNIILVYTSKDAPGTEIRVRTLKANGPKGTWTTYNFVVLRKG